jgi:hypothetical protein
MSALPMSVRDPQLFIGQPLETKVMNMTVANKPLKAPPGQILMQEMN